MGSGDAFRSIVGNPAVLGILSALSGAGQYYLNRKEEDRGQARLLEAINARSQMTPLEMEKMTAEIGHLNRTGTDKKTWTLINDATGQIQIIPEPGDGSNFTLPEGFRVVGTGFNPPDESVGDYIRKLNSSKTPLLSDQLRQKGILSNQPPPQPKIPPALQSNSVIPPISRPDSTAPPPRRPGETKEQYSKRTGIQVK